VISTLAIGPLPVLLIVKVKVLVAPRVTVPGETEAVAEVVAAWAGPPWMTAAVTRANPKMMSSERRRRPSARPVFIVPAPPSAVRPHGTIVERPRGKPCPTPRLDPAAVSLSQIPPDDAICIIFTTADGRRLI
jgi:hypothetical protein